MPHPSRVILVAENASDRMGGEAAIPAYYFRGLRARDIDTYLVVHERCRTHLQEMFPDQQDRCIYVEDSRLQRLLTKLAHPFPARIADRIFGLGINLLTQHAQRRSVRKLAVHGAVVHQPTPVAPRYPSMMYGIGAPVVIGPMNGNMEYPAAFASSEEAWVSGVIRLSRSFSSLVHYALPGKRNAAVMIAANERTRQALPHSPRGSVQILVENGVELDAWQPATHEMQPYSFVFAGRLVDWKMLDLLLYAVQRVPKAKLDIAGEGPQRKEWEKLARDLGIASRVRFHGWCSPQQTRHLMQRSQALLLSSVYECGGAVVLEAMSLGTPAVATRWGGPVDYIDDTCGILVEPAGRESMIRQFAAAMQQLIDDSTLRQTLGEGAKTRIQNHFSWERKIDAMLAIYGEALTQKSVTPVPHAQPSAAH